MRREAARTAAMVASLVLATLSEAQPPPRGESAAPVVELLQVVPLEPLPVTTSETADYVGRVIQMLDACARSAPPSSVPFAGTVRLVILISTRGTTLDVVDVEAGLADLRTRCLERAAPLPPLATIPTYPSYSAYPAVARIYVSARIDARGLTPLRRTDMAPTLPAGPVELVLDTQALVLNQYDARLRPEDVRDDFILGISPFLPALSRCLDPELRRHTYRGEALRVTLRIDPSGHVREVDVDSRFSIARCFRAALVEPFGRWRSRSDTRLTVRMAPR